MFLITHTVHHVSKYFLLWNSCLVCVWKWKEIWKKWSTLRLKRNIDDFCQSKFCSRRLSTFHSCNIWQTTPMIITLYMLVFIFSLNGNRSGAFFFFLMHRYKLQSAHCTLIVFTIFTINSRFFFKKRKKVYIYCFLIKRFFLHNNR